MGGPKWLHRAGALLAVARTTEGTEDTEGTARGSVAPWSLGCASHAEARSRGERAWQAGSVARACLFLIWDCWLWKGRGDALGAPPRRIRAAERRCQSRCPKKLEGAGPPRRRPARRERMGLFAPPRLRDDRVGTPAGGHKT